MTEILDVSRDNDTGEITQFLIIDETGQPDTKIASPENMLLYDPVDGLPFDGGMHDFLSGDSAIRLSEEPFVAVAQAGDEYSYIVTIRNSTVETTPDQASDLLSGVYEAMASEDLSSLKSLHAHIMANQVRRNLVNMLVNTFNERDRIDIVDNGWLVDGFYLVDWNAKMYTANDDDGDNYIREGTETVKKDKSYEFVRFRGGTGNIDPSSVHIGSEEYMLSEREMLFLAKIKWLLHRRHFHPDKPFWKYVDRWSDVEVETGRPPDNMDKNLDQFDI